MLNCGTAVMEIFTAFSVSLGAFKCVDCQTHKLVVFLPPLVLFCSIFGAANSVLPSYIPAFGVLHLERDALIE